MDIEIHIEELVLHGFTQRDGLSIGEAVRQALAELLMDRGTPQKFVQGGQAAALRGDTLPIAHGANPEMVGRQVAAAVYGTFVTP